MKMAWSTQALDRSNIYLVLDSYPNLSDSLHEGLFGRRRGVGLLWDERRKRRREIAEVEVQEGHLIVSKLEPLEKPEVIPSGTGVVGIRQVHGQDYGADREAMLRPAEGLIP